MRLVVLFARSIKRPSGARSACAAYPTLKRRAIVKCPFGTKPHRTAVQRKNVRHQSGKLPEAYDQNPATVPVYDQSVAIW